jgi:hypothetical protein
VERVASAPHRGYIGCSTVSFSSTTLNAETDAERDIVERNVPNDLVVFNRSVTVTPAEPGGGVSPYLTGDIAREKRADPAAGAAGSAIAQTTDVVSFGFSRRKHPPLSEPLGSFNSSERVARPCTIHPRAAILACESFCTYNTCGGRVPSARKRQDSSHYKHIHIHYRSGLVVLHLEPLTHLLSIRRVEEFVPFLLIVEPAHSTAQHKLAGG